MAFIKKNLARATLLGDARTNFKKSKSFLFDLSFEVCASATNKYGERKIFLMNAIIHIIMEQFS